MITPVEQLSQVVDATEVLVAGVREDQWAAATPCTEWNVRDLVNHMVAGNRRFTSILGGEAPLFAGDDLLGDDPVAAYRKAADALLAAFGRPGVLEKTFSVPIGTVPGIVAVHLRAVEMLAHGWDLARATGQATRYPDDVVEQQLVFTRDNLGDIPAGRSPFGTAQPVADDAPAIDRLAAALGRSVA